MAAERWQAVKRLLQDTLDRPPGERPAFLEAECGHDSDLRAEVADLVRAHAAAGDRFEAPPLAARAEEAPSRGPQPPAPPEHIGPYRVLRELGRGGMATVYLAERDGGDFRQQVAIKLIDQGIRGMDSAAIVQRFRTERRILAGLSHPNISRFFDGGTTVGGLPYFVMEHVDGAPIVRWCDDRGVSVDERVRLFRQVCAAVHYAHQNLVVHRDLKPGNILVTSDGTPKLLDFGIAKLLAVDDAASPVGDDLTAFARPMTPDYASPEQVRGEAITTASDVYSLGVLLYQLLTGRMPYRIARDTGAAELIRIVSEQQPEPPSTAACRRETATARDEGTPGAAAAGPRPALSKDLDAIVLQAMRKDPARRYASADQLSEDLRRYLEHLPVVARRDALGYRARKFVERHRAGVLAATLAGLALVATTGVAVVQARAAERERQRAERRFADVRRLANSFLFEFHDAIQDLPGSIAARELVVRKALEYLDGLAAESGDHPGDPAADRGLLAELAQAYQRVGDVQGMPYRASLGHTEDALRSYEKALALRRRLLAEAPTSELRLAAAEAETRIGAVLAARGDTRGALVRHRSALAEISALTRGASFAAARSAAAPAAVAVGDDQWELGDMAAAVAEYRGALGSAEDLRRERPTDREARRYVGVVEQRLGDALGLQGLWTAALAHHQASLAVDRALAEDSPSSAETQRDLATDYVRLAVAHQALKDLPATLREHRQALEIREHLRSLDAKDSRALTDLAESLVQIADVEAQAGDTPTALAHFRRALPLRREQAAIDSTNLRWQDDLAAGLTHYGTALATSDRAGALAALREALAVREAIAAKEPAFSASNPALANLYLTLGRFLSPPSGAPGGEACAWFAKATQAFEGLAQGSGLAGDAVAWAAAAQREAARCRG